MNKEYAKRILLAYRPGSDDEEDAEVAEALRLAQRDAELQGWLQEQVAFHRSVRSQLRQISPPPGLKDAILAYRKMVRPIWRRPEFWLAAACVALTLLVTAFWIRGRPEDLTFAGFQSRMVGSALRLYSMDIVTNDPGQVRRFLAGRGAPADYTVAPGLQRVPVMGGARLFWQGHPVAMICFGLPRNQILYMFVMDQAAIQHGQLPGAIPVLKPVKGIMTASWSRNGRLYLVAAAAESDALKKLIGAAGFSVVVLAVAGFVVGAGPPQ